MIVFLNSGGRLAEEGIFRVAGSEERRQQLIATISSDATILWVGTGGEGAGDDDVGLRLTDADTLVVAQVIKAVVRELNPMAGTYGACVAAALAHAGAETDEAASMALAAALRKVMEGLDSCYLEVTYALFRFLGKVATYKVSLTANVDAWSPLPPPPPSPLTDSAQMALLRAHRKIRWARRTSRSCSHRRC